METVEDAGVRSCPPPPPGSDILLVFDGGAIGNPGRGYGSFVFTGAATGGPIKISYPGLTTNNVAEYQTLIGALRAVLSQLESSNQRADDLTIEIRSDSQLLVNQLSGRWKVRNAALQRLHKQARTLMDQFGKVRLNWQPRRFTEQILGH